MDDDLRQQIWDRAGNRCEYCRLPSAFSRVNFEIDHIIARKHRGASTTDNLALSCFYCNSAKGSDIASVDPKSGEIVRLFNPRTDQWNRHFRWNGARIVGRTAIGRATVEVLVMNRSEFVLVRSFLMREGAFEIE